MRISRGNQVIGDRSVLQIKKGLEDASLLETDLYYQEEESEWLPLSDLLAKQALPKVEKPVGPPCYCGSRLSFRVCCGDGSQY